MTRTLWMWAAIAAMVRPFTPGGVARHAASGTARIRYSFMRLFAAKLDASHFLSLARLRRPGRLRVNY
jgi:hypothetical protein